MVYNRISSFDSIYLFYLMSRVREFADLRHSR